MRVLLVIFARHSSSGLKPTWLYILLYVPQNATPYHGKPDTLLRAALTAVHGVLQYAEYVPCDCSKAQVSRTIETITSILLRVLIFTRYVLLLHSLGGFGLGHSPLIHHCRTVEHDNLLYIMKRSRTCGSGTPDTP